MRPFLLAASLVLATVAAGSAFALPPQPGANPSASAQTGIAQISPAASDAVQVVNTFMEELATGQLEAARQLMTPNAVVMANGQVLGTRDGYIDGAAKGDATALQGVQREILRRDADAGPNAGWVVSEKRMRGPGGAQGAPREVVVTETMLLARTTAGWKITHIHWSSRQAG